MNNRRIFIKQSLLSSASIVLIPQFLKATVDEPRFKISLAEWSLHRALKAGKIDHLDFPRITKNDFGIDAVEYVNGFFGGKKLNFKEAGKNKTYLNELLQRSKDAGVYNHLIMVDEEGLLASSNMKEAMEAAENHKKWIDAAALLGCATVRVNLHGEGNPDAKKDSAVKALTELGRFARPMNINVVVENHGSDSSWGNWLVEVMKEVNQSNVGTLPDFGNFCISHPWGTTQEGCDNVYDRYKGVEEMLPFAKGVSAKTYDFDGNGEQPMMDYKKLMDMVKQSSFKGYIGIEYEGKSGNEEDGIRKTKALIEKYM